MKYLVVLLIVGSLVYLVYENVTLRKEEANAQKELKETKAKLSKIKKGEEKKAEQRIAPSTRTGRKVSQIISCPYCVGTGQKEQTDSRGRNRFIPCILCSGKGKHTLVMPGDPGTTICPSCQGIGRTIVTGIGLSKKGRVSVTIDNRCKGKGYL